MYNNKIVLLGLFLGKIFHSLHFLVFAFWWRLALMLHQVEVGQQWENSCGKNCTNYCSKKPRGWFYNEQFVQLKISFQIEEAGAVVCYTFQEAAGQLDKSSQDANNEAIASCPVDLEDTFVLEVVSVINWSKKGEEQYLLKAKRKCK